MNLSVKCLEPKYRLTGGDKITSNLQIDAVSGAVPRGHSRFHREHQRDEPRLHLLEHRFTVQAVAFRHDVEQSGIRLRQLRREWMLAIEPRRGERRDCGSHICWVSNFEVEALTLAYGGVELRRTPLRAAAQQMHRTEKIDLCGRRLREP